MKNKKLEVYNVKDNIQDREKIYALEDLFNNDMCFFNLKFEIAISILKFLGIEDKDLISTYNKLVDPSLIISKNEIKKQN